jgi:hypothetical protein
MRPVEEVLTNPMARVFSTNQVAWIEIVPSTGRAPHFPKRKVEQQVKVLKFGYYLFIFLFSSKEFLPI